ncbi:MULTISPECIES: class I SAM-dependent methyltransferase [unclassified Okeania]|uniref:class I SAM-dependent methyltransferase n=2 Tax=Microcoleaceae TaxID=1892252 RepID=UPI0013BCDB07|nr:MULTISPECIES: class I SAM-dependent methyltransferase [unclassified Okeania]NES78477.1 methyltransferase domain-containing protein [Okeania sp. SIO1H4]NET17234.1 methyltransferase domain-containing protein [Okeania sp. SIO1H6]NET21778.1 methyltransferase domain-containing protein [Okeania sp. SIO1H5]NET95985.1 methyltransferase domain-containing protein [Okeania sp. SIO1H2]
MFDSYKDIFNQRGLSYHQAMMTYPLARAEEFNQVLKLAKIKDDNVICDVPSGGCYLSNFIPRCAKLISIETSEKFIECSQKKDHNIALVCENISHIPLLSESIDRVISLAALHHVDDKFGFYQEAYRLLAQGGICCLADVRKGSKVADFLNIFVDRYNSMGHQGAFWDKNTANQLETVGFQVLVHQAISFDWQFDSLEDMVNFCKLLFGIDKTDNSKILEGIEQYLSYRIEENHYYLCWELEFFQALKSGI